MKQILGLMMVALMHILPVHTAGALDWFPDSKDRHPRIRADWQEPRLGLTWHGRRLQAALGGPIPLISGGTTTRWGFGLEGLATLGLSRDGAFFPLQTVDGSFMAAIETSRASWKSKFRIVHWSAHKADGDTTVAYRDKTFSREWLSLEIGRSLGECYVYGRLAGAWHAVPKSQGLKTAWGAQWDPSGTGFFVSSHFISEAAAKHRLEQTHVLGWAWKDQGRAYLGLRYHRGFSPAGQYLDLRDNFWALEVQFEP